MSIDDGVAPSSASRTAAVRRVPLPSGMLEPTQEGKSTTTSQSPGAVRMSDMYPPSQYE